MNLHLTPELSSFFVASRAPALGANLRNSLLLRAIRALNLNNSGAICFVQN
ncbi:MAG: hypothetical protein V3W04_04340 [Gammaproteobacteria bacterium]